MHSNFFFQLVNVSAYFALIVLFVPLNCLHAQWGHYHQVIHHFVLNLFVMSDDKNTKHPNYTQIF